METKFTKGEWRAALDFTEITTSTVGVIESSKRVCTISEFCKSTTEIKANAKLIAAAPELLKDLIHACALLKNISPNNVKLFEKTIKKATKQKHAV